MRGRGNFLRWVRGLERMPHQSVAQWARLKGPPLTEKEIAELRKDMLAAWWEIYDFCSTQQFRELLAEMRSKPPQAQRYFVRRVILDRNELAKRSIRVPKGLLIQRSKFGDRRRNLFCVKKYVRPGINSNITFS